MLVSFAFNAPQILLEAVEGDLFVPLGPDLVECICALRCIPTENGARADVRYGDRLDPNASLSVVVVACREKPGEIGYYPPGTCSALPAATPVVFLEQVGWSAFRARLDPPTSHQQASEPSEADRLIPQL